MESAHLTEHYGDYVPPFTKKEFGQLTTFGTGCPAGQAASILQRCLSNWDDFTAYAKDKCAAFPIPACPTLDFLIKYPAAAINFAMKAAKQAAIPKGVLDYQKHKAVAPAFKQPVQSLAPEPTMTKEELLESLAEDANPAVGVAAGHKKSVSEPKGTGLTIDQMMAIEEEKHNASLTLPE